MAKNASFFSLICVALAIGIYCTSIASAADDKPDYKELRRFREVMGVIQKHQVNELTDKQLVEGAIQGMIRGVNASESLRKEIESLQDDPVTKPSVAAPPEPQPSSKLKWGTEKESVPVEESKPAETKPSESTQSSPIQQTTKSPDYKEMRRLWRVITLIKKEHSTSDAQLVRWAIEGMLRSVDPKSKYWTENEYKVETESKTASNRCTLGIAISVPEKESEKISLVVQGSPADAAKIRPGDEILKIDGVPISQMTWADARRKSFGKLGSKVVYTISGKSFQQPKDIELKYQNVVLPFLSALKLEKGIHYIRLIQTTPETLEGLKKTLKRIQDEEWVTGIVLDLRNNGGGSVADCVAAARLFLHDGLIMYTDGRAANQRMQFTAQPNDRLYSGKLAVLINEWTYGGGEFQAGAFQDRDRALLFGIRSYGGGKVYTMIPFGDGNQLKLSTALFFTPKGHKIDGSGVEPDVRVDAGDSNQVIRAQLPDSKTMLQNDSVLKRAVNWLKSDVTVEQYKRENR